MVLILLDVIEKEEALANSHVTRGELNPFLLTQLVFRQKVFIRLETLPPTLEL